MTTTDRADRRTRQRVLEAAVPLLAERGLAGDVLERAAERVGCSLERARRFFHRDEELVLALYLRFAAELEARVAELPETSVADRFRAAMLAKLDLLAPYRDAFAALLAVALDPRHELGALGPYTELVRTRVAAVFSAVVLAASDRPKAPADAALARTLYAAHLAIVLLWTQDRTADGRAARAAVDFVHDVVARAGPAMRLARVRRVVDRLDGVAAALVEPPPDPAATALSAEVLRALFRHRRLLPGAGRCAAEPCEACLALHLPRVRRFVLAGEPVHFVLPAFPAKSPNRHKTLGPLPDMAEEVALGYLQAVSDEIARLYPPGARITICSDGRVFGDLVLVPDEDVTRYGEEIDAMIARLGTRSLDTFATEDLFEMEDFDEMRRELSTHYAEPLEVVEQRAREFEHHRALFNGIHRFLFEDRVVLSPEKSRTRVRDECKTLAHEVIRRSNAWGRLVADCFPTALRLSIHPQPPHSDKIGILLAAADDAWLTPWHGVALRRPGGYTLVPRQAAEALGARLVMRDGRASHFELGAFE